MRSLINSSLDSVKGILLKLHYLKFQATFCCLPTQGNTLSWFYWTCHLPLIPLIIIHRSKDSMIRLGCLVQFYSGSHHICQVEPLVFVWTKFCLIPPNYRGVPQGSVLVLFLLYILPLGTMIRSYNNVSYHFYFSFKPNELHKLSSLTDCLTNIKKWLNANYLKLNSDKTETLIIAPDDKIPQIRQYIGDVLGSSVQSSLRNLGVTFDSAMSLEQHSRQLIRNCFFHPTLQN